MTYDRDSESGREFAPCPPGIKGLLAGMEELIGKKPSYNDIAMPAQVAVDLILAGQTASFAEFEAWLRELGSQIYLVAIPREFYSEAWRDRVTYPWESDELPEYILWPVIDGSEAAEDLLSKIGSTPAENLSRLPYSGFVEVEEQTKPPGGFSGTN